ncbi:uncharacterized protein VTP21DRAFT_2384 [Calcarisporiella thermophila]|uniref:uncharacterized protein n=1 Tax=Calcarisporiella thermophila TaxID=911321 RepID=UPI0037431A26
MIDVMMESPSTSIGETSNIDGNISSQSSTIKRSASPRIVNESSGITDQSIPSPSISTSDHLSSTLKTPASSVTLILLSLNGSFATKTLELQENSRLKIGRSTSSRTAPSTTNGYFENRVLSRNHAEIWYDGTQTYLKDIKSSNGTFVNGERLSAEGTESRPVVLHDRDLIDFGIDILNDDEVVLYQKVSAQAIIFNGPLSQMDDATFKDLTASAANRNNGDHSDISSRGFSADVILTRLQTELLNSQEFSTQLKQINHVLADLQQAIQSGSIGIHHQDSDKVPELVRQINDLRSQLEILKQKCQLQEVMLQNAQTIEDELQVTRRNFSSLEKELQLAKRELVARTKSHEESIVKLVKENAQLKTQITDNANLLEAKGVTEQENERLKQELAQSRLSLRNSLAETEQFMKIAEEAKDRVRVLENELKKGYRELEYQMEERVKERVKAVLAGDGRLSSGRGKRWSFLSESPSPLSGNRQITSSKEAEWLCYPESSDDDSSRPPTALRISGVIANNTVSNAGKVACPNPEQEKSTIYPLEPTKSVNADSNNTAKNTQNKYSTIPAPGVNDISTIESTIDSATELGNDLSGPASKFVEIGTSKRISNSTIKSSDDNRKFVQPFSLLSFGVLVGAIGTYALLKRLGISPNGAESISQHSSGFDLTQRTKLEHFDPSTLNVDRMFIHILDRYVLTYTERFIELLMWIKILIEATL